MFLAQNNNDECDGYRDHNWNCIEEVTCDAPVKGDDVIVIKNLPDEASIASGCTEVREKLRMDANRNTISNVINGIPVKAGEITARANIMTSLKGRRLKDLKKCFITLKIPRLDQNGCWEYEDSAATSESLKYWSKLTEEQKLTVDRTKYSLSYSDQKVTMKKIAQRQKIEMMLKLLSEIETADEFDDEVWANEATKSGQEFATPSAKLQQNGGQGNQNQGGQGYNQNQGGQGNQGGNQGFNNPNQGDQVITRVLITKTKATRVITRVLITKTKAKVTKVLITKTQVGN